MRLFINNKVFIGKYNDKEELIIPLTDKDDIVFFKSWQNKEQSVKLKKDYVKDISIVKITESGTLYNCWPIVSDNEDEVQIIYDFYGSRRPIAVDFHTPKTRGELFESLEKLFESLEKGVSCRVAGDNAEITNSLLTSLKIMKKSDLKWTIDHTIESGWAIFVPEIK